MTEPTDTLTLDLRRCRRGDEMAARRLYARVGGAMEMVAFACTNDRAAAQDVVQTALVRVLETPAERVDAVRDALAWLLKITRNTALNHRRTDSRRGARERTAATLRGHHRNGEPARPEDHLLTAIGTLSLEHREIIILRHFIGLTWTQAGDTLGLTDSACAARHRAALNALRTTLIQPHASDCGVQQ